MKTRTFTWPSVAATLILAIGLQLVWGTLVVWTASFVAQLRQARDQVYESVAVARDGTPVIVSRSYANYIDVTYRTVDGKLLPNQRDEWLTGARLPEPSKPPGLFEPPMRWPSRVAGLSDAQRPPVAWYVIRDDRPVGRAYVVGYDEFAKLPVGYIGRHGFRRAMPPENEWFALGRRELNWGSGVLASTGPIQYGGMAITYASSFSSGAQRLPEWLVFLIDGDRVEEIDLRARTLRTVFESSGLLSVSGLLESRPAATNVVDQTEADAEPATARREDDDSAAGDSKLVARIALRTMDRIIVLDPPTAAKREYLLPESVHDKDVEVFATGDEQLLVMWRDANNYYETTLLWLAADGSVAREAKVTLVGYQGGTGESLAMGVAAAPVPLGWMGGVFVGGPIGMLQTHQAATYSEAVAHGLLTAWPGLVAVIFIGVVLAAVTYRLQRKYHRAATIVWCTFVFLLGWSAFLAYWVEQRQPKLESCGECGTVVPRDREACAACDAQFSTPSLVGTEIFA